MKSVPGVAAAEPHCTVAVLQGGCSAEREISLQSGAMVLRSLERLGIPALAFDPGQRALGELPTLCGKAFIALHGGAGEDGTLQGALEMLGLPYTGSGVLASALCLDKTRLKWLWQACGLPTPEFFEWRPHQEYPRAAAARLGYPLMVKPVCEGSSIGAVRVNEQSALRAALEQAAAHGGRVLVERWIEGEEYTVAVLGDRVLPAVRLQTPREFYDYQAKYESTETRYLCPCGLKATEEEEMAHLARRAFQAPGACGWGRVDLMREPHGAFQLLEVNTVPGLSAHSLVPKAARAAGMDFDELVRTILEGALLKGARKNAQAVVV